MFVREQKQVDFKGRSRDLLSLLFVTLQVAVFFFFSGQCVLAQILSKRVKDGWLKFIDLLAPRLPISHVTCDHLSLLLMRWKAQWANKCACTGGGACSSRKGLGLEPFTIALLMAFAVSWCTWCKLSGCGSASGSFLHFCSVCFLLACFFFFFFGNPLIFWPFFVKMLRAALKRHLAL